MGGGSANSGNIYDGGKEVPEEKIFQDFFVREGRLILRLENSDFHPLKISGLGLRMLGNPSSGRKKTCRVSGSVGRESFDSKEGPENYFVADIDSPNQIGIYIINGKDERITSSYCRYIEGSNVLEFVATLNQRKVRGSISPY